MSDDLISRSALKKEFDDKCAYECAICKYSKDFAPCKLIDDAPTVDTTCPNCDSGYAQGYSDGYLKGKEERLQGERWIPVSERLPEDETEVLIQYGQSMMVGYHIFDHTLYPFGYEDEDETGWYNSKDDFICETYDVIAWMPLPEPYKEVEKDEQSTNDN